MKGNRIKLLREEKEIKQEDLAKIIDVSPSAVGMYERDEREPNDEITLKLAEYFGVSTDYLLGKSDVRNPEEVNIDDVDVAFSSGIKGLNETNKMIIKNTLEALIAKQKQDEEKKGENKWINLLIKLKMCMLC